MNSPLQLDFGGVVQRVGERTEGLRGVETVCVRDGVAQQWWGHDLKDRCDGDEYAENITARDAIEQIEMRLPPATSVLCHFPTHTTLRLLKDLKPLIDRKPFTDKLIFLQFFPQSNLALGLHHISLHYISQSYQSSYTVSELTSKDEREGTNERYYRKLKSESTRLVMEIEAATGMKLISVRLSYVISEGVLYLQWVEKCVLGQSPTGGTPKTSRGFGSRLKINRDLIRKADEEVMLSPRRVRTPALTCPNSPRSQSRTDGSSTPRLPAVSPRSSPFFNQNFKEMIALTLEKHQSRKPDSLTKRRPPLAEIEELVKDDDKFFELVGIRDVQRKEEMKEKDLGVSMSETGLSSASTCSSRTKEGRIRPLIRHIPPLPRKFHPLRSPK